MLKKKKRRLEISLSQFESKLNQMLKKKKNKLEISLSQI